MTTDMRKVLAIMRAQLESDERDIQRVLAQSSKNAPTGEMEILGNLCRAVGFLLDKELET